MNLNANARQFRTKMTKQPEIASCPRWIVLSCRWVKLSVKRAIVSHMQGPTSFQGKALGTRLSKARPMIMHIARNTTVKEKTWSHISFSWFLSETFFHFQKHFVCAANVARAHKRGSILYNVAITIFAAITTIFISYQERILLDG